MKESIPKIEHHKPRPPLKSDKFVFDLYIKELQLTPEDFEKKILDIGAGSMQFAKYAEEQGIGNKIFSLEPEPHKFISKKPKTVGGEAGHIPFKDESFDLVISAGAIPTILVRNNEESVNDPETWIKFDEYFKRIMLEMLRVTRVGGEIRMGPMAEGRVFKKNLLMKRNMNLIIAGLISEGRIIAEEISTGQLHYADGKDIGYLVKIKKLK